MLINFKDNGKWGYYNSKTKKTIPAQFRDDSDFVDGFAIVKQYSNSLYGVIDEEGNDVIPFIFNLLERQDNGLFKAGSHYFNCLYNQKGEIVDADGIALDDRFQKYDVVKPFGNDLYIFKKGATNGVINKDKVIIEKNDSYHDYVEITPFLYFFRLKDSQGSIRYYNYDGLHIFSEAYDINLISDEYVVFYAGYDKGYGIANALGEILLPANYDEIAYIGNDLFTLGYKKEYVRYDAKKNSYIVKNGENEVVVPKAMEWCGNFENGKAIIAIGHKYGIIDSNFNTCVACDYERIELGYDNTAIVEAEGKCHLLDSSNGKIITTYDEITLLSYNYFLFKKDGYYGVIDNNGSIIIQAHYDKNIELLDDGNFRVSRNSSEKNYCIIDRDSHIIILTSKGFRHLDKEIIWVNNFSEGLAIVENTEGLKGAINEQGNFVIPCQFEGSLSDFHLGYSTNIYYNCGYKKQKIDTKGQIVSSKKEDEASGLSGKKKIPDSSGYVIISEKYKKTRDHFSDGLAAVSNDEGLWGFVNKMGQEQIPCIYYEVHDFKDGYCVVSDGYRLCVIDKIGRVILSGDFSRIEIRNDSTFFVAHNQFGYIDNYSVPDEWGGENEYSEDIPECRTYNSNGNIVVPLYDGFVAIPKEYEWCDEKFHEGFLSVYKNGMWGIINTRLELVVECIYYERFRFEDGIAIAKSDNVTVVLNTLHTLFWGDYSDIKKFREYNLFICKSNQGHYDVYNGFGILLFSSTAINSRIQIFDKMSKDRYNPTVIIPIDNNFFKYEICTINNGIKWGICGLNGEIVLEACFDDIGGMGSGLVSVKKQLWGYVDMKGNIVVDFKYANVKPFSKGMAQVQKELYGKWGLISTDGKELTDFVYDKFSEHSSGDLLSYFHNHYESPILISEQGAIHYQYYYGDHDRYSRDVFLFGYDWCSDIYDGLCIVIKGNCYGIIEESGRIKYPLCEMGDVRIVPNADGYIVFCKGKEYKKVTNDGRIITRLNKDYIDLPVGIHWCDEWIDGYIAVESNGKWGLLNSELTFVLETQFDNVQYIGNKRALCESSESEPYSIYNIETGSYMHLPYDGCSLFENGYAIVAKIIKETKNPWSSLVSREFAYGLIDNMGQELMPCDYTQIQFKKPLKNEIINSDTYEEPYDWKSDYRDAFEDEPGATWGREW